MNLTSILDTGAGPKKESTAENVYHLPCPSTGLQSWLIEVLLALHKPSLVQQMENQETNKVKHEDKDNADIHKQMNLEALSHTLANNWLNVLNHPFLLVDHFVPKNLILMESGPNLIKDSGKFRKFDQLINKLEKLEYHTIVVARTLKELDLIEGYLLGRKLNYKRYTGASLYDNNPYMDPKGPSTDGIRNGNTNGVYHDGHGYKKHEHYLPKPSKSSPQAQYLAKNPKDKLTVHLISSNMVKTISFSPSLKFNLIISFDAELSSLTYLRQLKSCDSSQLIPVIKLVSFNSIEQYKLQQTGEETLTDVLCKSMVHRNDRPVDMEVDLQWLKDCDSVEWSTEFSECQPSSLQDAINSLKDETVEQTMKKVKIESQDELTANEYKQSLTMIIKQKLADLSKAIQDRNKKLDPIRNKESITQVQIETKNQQIADLVRAKQKLEVELNGLTKRSAKLNSDVERLSKTKETKNKILSNDDLKLEDIDIGDGTELETLNKLNDEVRQEYQQESSKAAEISVKLNLLTSENTQLKAKLEDNTYKTIQEKFQSTNDASMHYQLEKLKRQNEFLSLYGARINTIIKNNNISDSGSSRTSNGRFSRSTTPRV